MSGCCAAAVIGLVCAGHLRQAQDRLGEIIAGGDGNLAGVLQMWLRLALAWLDGDRAVMIMGWSGMPTAMVDPHGADPDPAGDAIDRVHLLDLIGALIDAPRRPRQECTGPGGDVRHQLAAR